MRILLMHPNYHSGGAEIAGNWPPAWVAYLTGYLKAGGYTDVTFVDAMTHHLDDEAVRAVCLEAAEGDVLEAVNFNSHGQVVIAGHGKIDVLGAVEDNTRPELDSYWVWRVDANCMLNIPEDAEAPVIRPTEIYVSHVKEETNTVVSGPDLIIEG
jgi:hypothetical protein